MNAKICVGQFEKIIGIFFILEKPKGRDNRLINFFQEYKFFIAIICFRLPTKQFYSIYTKTSIIWKCDRILTKIRKENKLQQTEKSIDKNPENLGKPSTLCFYNWRKISTVLRISAKN